ncbi:hypothetical protein BpHYR1_041315 [Brachionus plicatilis]|uniref:Uncharacterized protein n=1 Tax=Brachionus plicatilis TaxID=10195 RepID=A0A3M7P6Y8_BRAPC|nr:hypothetical protein BpHYR1_041315 [Brachionus plicatilis]
MSSLASMSSTVPSYWKATYSSCAALAIPTCVPRARNRPNPKWFNANIKQLIKIKYILHCLLGQQPLTLS